MENPLNRFKSWYNLAQSSNLVDADAIALATCSEDAMPSCRILYFRRLIGSSFCFFTNYLSHKGEDLGLNQRAEMVFLWHMIGKQLRIEGPVRKLSPQESDEYFYQRPLESQLSAATSKQSRELAEFKKFIDEVELKRQESSGKPKRPEHWGGYAIEAHKIEFWTQGEHRRHLRELFTKDGDTWNLKLLYP